MVNSKTLDDRIHWYKDAIIYELHIKAFFDANNDGIGDFEGLLQKLDYLEDLGVTAIWLLPFYPSPLRDDGYDIADYYHINPSFGNINQFKLLLKEAHKRNLKVITELVINHTSDQHPWFQRARQAPKGSPEREYYVWSDDPNKYKDVRIIFQDFETSNWTWDPVAQQYYWHRFFHHQPDLNFDNPLVQEEVFKIIDYWCGMGVDGFRLDAVPYLYEREGTNGENLPETHVYLKKLRHHIESRYPGICFLAEANMWPEDAAAYFGEGDECHMNYHFPVMPRMFMALQREDRYPITDIFDQTPPIPDNCQWAIFLRNHDELTLEMVTDEERDYMYKVYAKDPKAKINLGIRHRLAPLMENDRKRIELMNSLLFSLPGTPVIYYGDEIGMGDNFYLGDRDGVRTPMQWSPDRNAGFSTTNPHRLFLPVIIDPQYHYESVNVETQRSNTSSLFWFMKRIINMRKRYKAFGRGDFNIINVDNPKVLAFTRSYNGETLLIVVNLSKYSQPAELDLIDFTGFSVLEAFSKNPFPPVRDNVSYLLTLGPHAYHWFVLEKTEVEGRTEKEKYKIELEHWDNLVSKNVKEELAVNVIANYLYKCNWFVGRYQSIYNVDFSQWAKMPVARMNCWLLMLEINYQNGLPEQYFFPLAFVKGRKAKALKTDYPQAVLCDMRLGKDEGLLVDALYTEEVQGELFRLLTGQVQRNNLKPFIKDEVATYASEHPAIRSRMHVGEQLNTSITYDNKFFLKVFRKIDSGVNPDVEITRFLTEDRNFVFAPRYLGHLEWDTEGGSFVLGMLEVMVENHGNGRSFMMERINNYIERIQAREKSRISAFPVLGSFTQPVSFEDLNDDMKEFLGGSAADLTKMTGSRLAELHNLLASGTENSFKPEAFSLHYQRSLYSAMQSLVRETFQNFDRRKNELPESVCKELKELADRRGEILDMLRRIYSKKFDVVKTRVHGFFGLDEILLTGKDIMIHNFNGNPFRSFSERRLKRSPLRDVAAMIRSLYYVAYHGFMLNAQIRREELSELLSFADFWAFYMSSFFMRGYLDCLDDHSIVPKDDSEMQILIETYMTENALHYLNYEISYRQDWALVPGRIIQSILNAQKSD